NLLGPGSPTSEHPAGRQCRALRPAHRVASSATPRSRGTLVLRPWRPGSARVVVPRAPPIPPPWATRTRRRRATGRRASPPPPTPGARGLAIAGRPPAATVLGDYRLVRKLGEGAMGAVYKAKQTSTGQNVALKVLFQHVAKKPRCVERFAREARVMMRLEHPN